MTNQTIGQRLKTLRTNNNLSLTQLCESCGWADVCETTQKTRIRRYENDSRQPGIDELLLLANALNTSINYLATGQEDSGSNAVLATGADQIQYLPIDQITPSVQGQPREEFDQEKLQHLADSITHHGVIQPITVQQLEPNGRYIIVCGERRWRASQLAGQPTVPAIVNNNIKDDDLFAIQIIENLQRADLSLAETAKGVHRLRQEFSLEETAQKLGRSTSWVSRRANIPTLPDHVWQAVQNGHIGDANMASDLANLHGLDEEKATQITQRLAGKSTGSEYVDHFMKPETITRAYVADQLKTTKDNIKRQQENDKREAQRKAEAADQQASAKTEEQIAAQQQQDADYAAQQKAKQASDKARFDLIASLRDTTQFVTKPGTHIDASIHDQSWQGEDKDILLSIDITANQHNAPHIRDWLNTHLPQLADLIIKQQTEAKA